MEITEHPLFRITEKCTDKFIEKYKAQKAIIYYRNKGSALISEPFLEIEIYWKSSKDLKKFPSQMADMASEICTVISAITYADGFMVDPIWELDIDRPALLVWAVFFKKHSYDVD